MREEYPEEFRVDYNKNKRYSTMLLKKAIELADIKTTINLTVFLRIIYLNQRTSQDRSTIIQAIGQLRRMVQVLKQLEDPKAIELVNKIEIVLGNLRTNQGNTTWTVYSDSEYMSY